MKTGWRIPLLACGALVLGALANLLFGAAPSEPLPVSTDGDDWHLPQGQVLDFERLDARWQARAPWPAPPPQSAADAAAAVEEAPPILPIGIARGRSGHEAIFSVPGAGELSVPPGGELPDGGRVLQVSALRVDWLDGKGRQQQREMFNTYHEQGAGTADSVPEPAQAGSKKPARRR